MENLSGSLGHVNVLRHPILSIRDINQFNREWPKMEASITFLFHWRGIITNQDKDWLLHYLCIFYAYIEPGVDFDDLNKLVFSLPNLLKYSKQKMACVLAPGSMVVDLEEVDNLIMIYWKEEEDS